MITRDNDNYIGLCYAKLCDEENTKKYMYLCKLSYNDIQNIIKKVFIILNPRMEGGIVYRNASLLY